jgi:uncharacterized protein YlzI (FlbEa/FlbD family)
MKRYKLTARGQQTKTLYFEGNSYVVAEMTDEQVDEIFAFGGSVYFESVEKADKPPIKEK